MEEVEQERKNEMRNNESLRMSFLKWLYYEVAKYEMGRIMPMWFRILYCILCPGKILCFMAAHAIEPSTLMLKLGKTRCNIIDIERMFGPPYPSRYSYRVLDVNEYGTVTWYCEDMEQQK